ncbi:MAG: hypothetical protein B6U69_03885 [Thermofilum sp. ex4484_15]|nr:MAG: hypothetical protein B6U69_03885 [Thermofilum sp. ex4484_15]
MELKFGTAGIPLSAKGKGTIEGIMEVKRLGLGAMELEFVRGVRLSEKGAMEVGAVAKSLNVTLTAHGPYYINLNSSDKAKVDASVKRILDTAKVAYAAGGYSITFHTAYYGNSSKAETYARIKKALTKVIRELQDNGITIWVRPETTGKRSQFGTLDEVIKLSEELEMVMPCIDFAHIHARSRGAYNSYEEFSSILELIERRLGKEALREMHIHVSGIEYGERGEVRHLNLKESDFKYADLLKAFKEFKVGGVVISESPNIEGDALLLKECYLKDP